MQTFHYLKNTFLVYIIRSIILGFAIFSLITVHKYNNYLTDTLGTVKKIVNNKSKVRRQIDTMEGMIKYLRDDLKIFGTDMDSEIIFFHTVDNIKKHMEGALITITDFKEVGDEKILPVQIFVPIKNYNMLLDYAGYIESFNIAPQYKVNRFSLSRQSKGEYVLDIQGVLRAPVFKTKT